MVRVVEILTQQTEFKSPRPQQYCMMMDVSVLLYTVIYSNIFSDHIYNVQPSMSQGGDGPMGKDIGG